MKISLYVVRDRVLEESSKLYEAKNDAVAVRAFQDLMKDNEFASDFSLLYVGWFDHGTEEGTFITPREVEVTLDTEIEMTEGDAN